jgi:hypothetical protein
MRTLYLIVADFAAKRGVHRATPRNTALFPDQLMFR